MHRWLGHGVPAEPEAARKTFAEYCAQGHDIACHAERGYMSLQWLAPYLEGMTAPYPRDAINAGLVRNRTLPKKRVVIGFCVLPDGSAGKTVILDSSGNEDVDDGAAKGVRFWRFPNRPTIAREELCMHVAFVLPPAGADGVQR